MPFKSLAQEGYLHAHPEILGNKIHEWDAATTGKHLPEHVKKYHDGTDYVPHDTLALLQKGEKVIPKKDNPMADWREGVTGKTAKPKKEIKRMIHEKSHNGGHIVTHEHHHPEHHPDEKHTFSNLADVAAHMEKHAGTPNTGETPDASATPMTAAPSPMAEAAPAAAGATAPLGV